MQENANVTPSDDPNLNVRRIIVCAPMKSGSTYIANVIGRYFGQEWPEMSAVNFAADHNFTSYFASELRGRPFTFNFHMLPHEMNVLLAQYHRVQLLCVWRNLGDMFVSIDDHAFREAGNGPAFYVTDLEEYRKLPQEQRYLVRIDSMLQWYLRFYVMWRRVTVVMHPYEQMLLEKEAFFKRILEPISGPVDEAQLRLAMGPVEATDRVNVGRAGRSATHLSDKVKRTLERRILRHPDWQQLEILLWELPWDVPALEPQHPYDGKVVASQGGKAYFVSRGQRYLIGNATWLESRVGDLRVPHLADADELERLPAGATLL